MSESAFNLLRPVCVKVMKTPSIEAVQQLAHLLEDINDDAVQTLQQYILLPLRIILKPTPPRSSELRRHTVDCIATVLKRSKVASWEVFSDFFVCLSLLVSSSDDHSKVLQGTEELKHSVVLCLKELINSASQSVLESLYSAVNLPMVGHTVSLLLQFVEHEQLRQLKINSMKTVLRLVQHEDSDLQQKSRQIFCSFLPGISLSLSSIISADPKQGQNVITVAIDTFAHIVSLLMDDDIPASNHTESDSSHQDIKNLSVRRTDQWLESTAQKLSILIGQICKLNVVDNWKIRVALVNFADLLLKKCSRSLKLSSGTLLKLLVSLLGDDWPQVAGASRDALDSFKKHHMGGDDVRLTEVLEDNLHQSMTSLPRVMRMTDDAVKLTSLNLIQGYLQLLGEGVMQFLLSSSHLMRLSVALVQVLTFDTTDILLMEESLLSTDGWDVESRASTRHPYQFKSFSDERIYQAVVQICHLLGMYGNLMLLTDNFLEVSRKSEIYTKQCVLIISEILKGSLEATAENKTNVKGQIGVSRELPELEAVVSSVLEELLSDDLWNLPTSTEPAHLEPAKNTSDWLVMEKKPTQTEQITVQKIQSNTLLSCIALEAISSCSIVLGPAFDPFLIQSLYPILEKMTEEKAVIKHAAFQTLTIISSSCGYSSIPDLLASNADYLVDSISSKLRHFDYHPRAPQVLNVTILNSESTILPLLEDTIEEILCSLDSHFAKQSFSFMSILQTLIDAVVLWFTERKSTPSEIEPISNVHATFQQSTPKGSTFVSEIVRYLVEYDKNRQIADGNDALADEEVNNDDDDEKPGAAGDDDLDGDGPDIKRELPLYLKITKKIFERCKHLLASKDPRIRIKVLAVIEGAVQVLSSEENELLPLAHQVWPSLVPRFQDEEPLVICMACQALRTMSIHCGDFLRRRVSSDVIPRIISILNQHQATSLKAGPRFIHTVTHKLQNSVLKLIGPLCRKVDICENDFNSLANACLPYLSKNQPFTLQEAAMTAFQDFCRIDADAIWFLLHDVACQQVFYSPSPEFKDINFCCNPRFEEFETNVASLLQHLSAAVENG